jgi:solute carrier family 25 (mitochondrial uncoupling protein), member 8/9
VCVCCVSNLLLSAVGITIASPTDVVKVRLQGEGRLAAGVPRRYSGALDAYSKIVRQEGVLGLWTGYGPNLARNCVVNATELVAYDQTKQTLLSTFHMQDGIAAHIVSGLSAGLAATLLGSPVDVVKTRVMNAAKDGSAPYKGPLDCAAWMLRTQGPAAFYSGFIPNFARIGSWNIVTWVTLEQLRAAYLANVRAHQ